MTKCKMCGQCCYMMTLDGKITKKKCKYLIKLKDKAICRIYFNKNRIGTKIDKINKCAMREQQQFNIPGCPYNRAEWPEAKYE